MMKPKWYFNVIEKSGQLKSGQLRDTTTKTRTDIPVSTKNDHI